jgi:hypothetical protein
VLRNCVQVRFLRTRQLSLCHFARLSVLEARVVIGEVQTGMTNLIFHKVSGHRICLRVANSTMAESVHSTGLYAEFFADWR